MQALRTFALAVAVAMLPLASLAAHHEEKMSIEDVARLWVEAYGTSVAEATAVIREHMAEDGVEVAQRYVGFGFTWNPDDGANMAVINVMAGSPAEGVLEVGDSFVSVNGVEVNSANLGKLSFRGKPGEPVKAVIMRDGKKMDVEVVRGVVAGTYTKAQALETLAAENADTWPADTVDVIEVLSKGNVVYVLSSYTDKDNQNGMPYEAYSISRFVFNDDAKVARHSFIEESRFILEQTGYSITR